MDKITDEAIIYQLEKIDQGGAITELFEDRMAWLADMWGYEWLTEGDHAGDIKLPDGRYATLKFEAVIYSGDS